MSLNTEERAAIVALELEKSENAFKDMEVLMQAGRWSGAAGRLYYAVFHAVNALLISDGHTVNTHKGANAQFSLHYVKTGVFPFEYGRLYGNLQSMRENSDYNCVYDVTEEEIVRASEPARRLIAQIQSYIAQKQSE